MDDGVASPCVKICRIEEALCIGCGRSLAEIEQWPYADAARKWSIRAVAADRLAALAARKPG